MQNHYSVLHIDDDSFIRRIIHQVLSHEYDLTSAVNGVEAMTWLEKGNIPDIIVTDLCMPLLSGQEVISLVRSSSLYRAVPIVVLSNLDDTALKVKCLDQGADDFLAKPFNPLELKSRIKALLRRKDEHRVLRQDFTLTRLSPVCQ